MPSLSASTRSETLWTADEAVVVFVLGGPGVGKGTQCAMLVRDYGLKHLSAGDLLRAEQDRPGSDLADLIRTHIKDGVIVPMEVTIQLLENAMREAMEREGKHVFLIDGFPRKMDQALKFEQVVVPARFTLFFHAPEQILLDRLLNRGKTSGRDDDNIESIRKRFRTFEDTSMPVVRHFEGQGRVERIEADARPDEVYASVRAVMEKRGIADAVAKMRAGAVGSAADLAAGSAADGGPSAAASRSGDGKGEEARP